jgi:hypothetical protein
VLSVGPRSTAPLYAARQLRYTQLEGADGVPELTPSSSGSRAVWYTGRPAYVPGVPPPASDTGVPPAPSVNVWFTRSTDVSSSVRVRAAASGAASHTSGGSIHPSACFSPAWYARPPQLERADAMTSVLSPYSMLVAVTGSCTHPCSRPQLCCRWHVAGGAGRGGIRGEG